MTATATAKRLSSVEGDSPWYMLIRAHDHVWRDVHAAQLLWNKSIEIAGSFPKCLHLETVKRSYQSIIIERCENCGHETVTETQL